LWRVRSAGFARQRDAFLDLAMGEQITDEKGHDGK
jgi:hypothetical protein